MTQRRAKCSQPVCPEPESGAHHGHNPRGAELSAPGGGLTGLGASALIGKTAFWLTRRYAAWLQKWEQLLNTSEDVVSG
jgi:hypothetical protein